MNQNSTREIGTLKYFRERIMRYNAPTTVKSNPDAYEEFFVSVGRAYLVEAFLEFFGMENTESDGPTKNLPDQNASLEAKKTCDRRQYGCHAFRCSGRFYLFY